ncbi:MAG: 50S ribosome-binding GTPase [Sporolactobacillus sp.]|nr:50S ribosome-binding GTPase [Sporolactobacillus sp.]
MLEVRKPAGTPTTAAMRILLIGPESSGKTTLFSRLTDAHTGDELNVKGSTYAIRVRQRGSCEFVDSPGLRAGDHLSNQVVKKEIARADRLILVVRGTQFHDELAMVLPLLADFGKPFAVFISHADKMTRESRRMLRTYLLKHHLPLCQADSRKLNARQSEAIRSFVCRQPSLTQAQFDTLAQLRPEEVIPQERIFVRNSFGYAAALICTLAVFLIPVMIAYQFSSLTQPPADQWIIQPIARLLSGQPDLIQELLTGKYGLLSLGIYSFIWAFPVVLLIGISTAIVDESGVKDRMVDCLDPLLHRIGLNGQDLVPVLSGFGCNVVAVFQSRNCSVGTRRACVSLIGFGSSCSYQIGATLSLFAAAHHVWLFLPYVLLLMLGGALHTRLWYGHNANRLTEPPFVRRSFLQAPTIKGIGFRVRSVIRQFLRQAMPIFIGICMIASVLDSFHLIDYLAYLFNPLLALFGLPTDAGIGLAFSMIRKDGMLVFNEGRGALLTQLSTAQLFLLVFIASTISACSVTIWTVAREMGLKAAAEFVGRQFMTSAICSGLLFAALFLLPALF